MNVKSFHIFYMAFVFSVHVYLVVRVNAYLKISSVGDLSKKLTNFSPRSWETKCGNTKKPSLGKFGSKTQNC